MKIELTEAQIVALFIDKMKGIDGSTITGGTYNGADPTAYEIVVAKVFLMYGYSFYEEGGMECPNCETVGVETRDITWGIEFKFATSKGVEEGYWDHHDKEWKHNTDGFAKVFKDLLTDGTEEPGDEDGYHDIRCEM